MNQKSLNLLSPPPSSPTTHPSPTSPPSFTVTLSSNSSQNLLKHNFQTSSYYKSPIFITSCVRRRLEWEI
ncbi:unnamed protein product [Moneuplotes crassus]|uniref:Uncharacterized protein n=1 Tax=Euplotes crassus TaxID=5936 RepID=A0AAD1UB61_EUPCR|nr:unnamed protein product [Moneuplotes crassus]